MKQDGGFGMQIFLVTFDLAQGLGGLDNRFRFNSLIEILYIEL